MQRWPDKCSHFSKIPPTEVSVEPGVRQETEKQVLPRLMLENQETSRALVVVQDHI